MSKVSIVSSVQLNISDDESRVILALLYKLNWNEFAFAEDLAAELEEVTGNSAVDISYNGETDEFHLV